MLKKVFKSEIGLTICLISGLYLFIACDDIRSNLIADFIIIANVYFGFGYFTDWLTKFVKNIVKETIAITTMSNKKDKDYEIDTDELPGWYEYICARTRINA